MQGSTRTCFAAKKVSVRTLRHHGKTSTLSLMRVDFFHISFCTGLVRGAGLDSDMFFGKKHGTSCESYKVRKVSGVDATTQGLGFWCRTVFRPLFKTKCGWEFLGARYRARLGHVFQQKLGLGLKGYTGTGFQIRKHKCLRPPRGAITSTSGPCGAVSTRIYWHPCVIL